MNTDDLEDWFKDKAEPWLDRFHQWGTDVQGNRWVFWTVVVMTVKGLVWW